MQTLLDALGAHTSRWDFPTPRPWPLMFYSTGVTNELVRTLGLSDKTPLGLPSLKQSSNSVLPVAWITRRTGVTNELCVDAGIVRQDSPRASRPQDILKLLPPCSLDYKAYRGPQTFFWFFKGTQRRGKNAQKSKHKASQSS